MYHLKSVNAETRDVLTELEREYKPAVRIHWKSIPLKGISAFAVHTCTFDARIVCKITMYYKSILTNMLFFLFTGKERRGKEKSRLSECSMLELFYGFKAEVIILN